MGLATNDCLRKNRYESREEGERVAKQRSAATGLKLKCYGCPLCGGFHLAKAKGRRSRQ